MWTRGQGLQKRAIDGRVGSRPVPASRIRGEHDKAAGASFIYFIVRIECPLYCIYGLFGQSVLSCRHGSDTKV